MEDSVNKTSQIILNNEQKLLHVIIAFAYFVVQNEWTVNIFTGIATHAVETIPLLALFHPRRDFQWMNFWKTLLQTSA